MEWREWAEFDAALDEALLRKTDTISEWRPRGSTQTECLLFAASCTTSLGPSYKENLLRGPEPPTAGLIGEGGRGQAPPFRSDGEEAKEDDPPEPKRNYSVHFINKENQLSGSIICVHILYKLYNEIS